MYLHETPYNRLKIILFHDNSTNTRSDPRKDSKAF